MSEIKEKQELIMKNVLSVRKKLTQQQIQEKMMKMGKMFKELEVAPNGSVVTATYSIENTEQGQILDFEVLVPLNKSIELPDEFKLKPIFKLTNALCIRHEGKISEFESSVNRLVEYINKNKLQQVTSAYNVQINNGDGINNVIVDCYIGVSDNIL